MVFKRFLIIVFCIASWLTLGNAYGGLQKQLDWVSTSKANNLCSGYYINYPIHFKPNKNLKHPEKGYNISADNVSYSLKGPSKLSGHVKFVRPNKRVEADKVWLYRSDQADHRLSRIQAKGGLRLYSPGQLMVAKQGQLNLLDNTFTVEDADYRVSSQPKNNPHTEKHKGQTVEVHKERHYRGHAHTIHKIDDQHYVLKDSTLTTCPPAAKGESCAWHIHATTVKLDNAKGVGHAYNALFWFHGAPIMYTPYANFPINDERKSGFLFPSYGRQANSGVHLSFPYYLNLAPNYDLTLVPQIYSWRGLMLGGTFRYLTEQGQGHLHASFMPEDRRFRDFQQQAQLEPNFQNRTKGLQRLEDDDSSRYDIHYKDQFSWNDHWFSQIDYNQVSDDYYIQDFGEDLINNSNANLLQKGQLQYQGLNWQFMGLLQNYQTLHPVNRQPNSNQYARLPELQASSDYAGWYPGLDPSVNIQSVYFHKTFRPDGSNGTPVNGERLSIQPDIMYTWERPYGYIKPEIKAQLTQYWLDHNHTGLHQQASQAIPTFDVQGKLNFQRFFQIADNHYEQTLEPEFFYVYTPYEPQDNTPIFDTSTRSFDYSYMFHSNRFSGADRVGDTNRLTLALTSRLLDSDTGNQKASVSIGDIVYFRNRQVTDCSGNHCQPDDLASRHFSPLVTKAEYDLAHYWKGKAQLVWNPYANVFSREQASIQFQDQQKYLFNIDFERLLEGGDISGNNSSVTTKLKQIQVGGAWKINPRWRVLGHMGYSWQGNNAKNHGDTYLAGIEYSGCCWGVRFVGARTFQGVDDQQRNKYDNRYYIQIIFKGLGSLGNRDPSSVLSDNLSNYKSEFNQAGML